MIEECIGTLFASNTIPIAINDTKKFINENTTFPTAKIYLGIYTFLINDADPSIELIAIEVDSDKKLNKVCPKIK